MIFISGIVISLFLAALLLFKKNKSLADRFLLIWILVIAIHQFYYYFDNSALITKYTFLIGYDMPIPLLHGPLLFLYASALTGRLPVRMIFRVAHFIPAAVCYLYLTGFYSLPGETKLYIIANEGAGYELFLKLRFIAVILSGVTYVLLTILLLKQHQKKIKDNFSDIEKINLKWLQFLNYGVGAIWLIVIFGSDELTFIGVVIYVVFIGIYGIRQTPIFTSSQSPAGLRFENTTPQLFDEIDASNENYPGISESGGKVGTEDLTEKSSSLETSPDSNSGRVKYQKSGLSEDDLQAIHRRLTDLMLHEKLYTEPEITLGEVAQKLHIHPNYLSQAINAKLNKTFYDYINSLRVEEFSRAVQDPKNQHFTLLSLAFGCGFNSKSSFNRNFRKVKGITPSHYLDQIHVSLEEAD